MLKEEEEVEVEVEVGGVIVALTPCSSLRVCFWWEIGREVR